MITFITRRGGGGKGRRPGAGLWRPPGRRGGLWPAAPLRWGTRDKQQEAASMAAPKAGGRSRRKASAGRGKGTVENTSGPGGGVTMVDLDPWGAFFEKFW